MRIIGLVLFLYISYFALENTGGGPIKEMLIFKSVNIMNIILVISLKILLSQNRLTIHQRNNNDVVANMFLPNRLGYR